MTGQENIKRLRIENKLSCRKLAKELHGISYTQISQVETGEKSPSLTFLKEYHKYFGVSFEYLLGETDEPLSTYNQIEKNAEEYIRELRCSNITNDKKQYKTIKFLAGTNEGRTLLYNLADILWPEKKDITHTNEEVFFKIAKEMMEKKHENKTYSEMRIYYRNKLNQF